MAAETCRRADADNGARESAGVPPVCPAWLVDRAVPWAPAAGRWQEARAGRGGLLLVTGEAGIGKTAFLKALAEVAAAGGATLLSGSHPDWPSPSPLYGLREAVGRLCGVRQTDTAATVASRVQTMLGRLSPDMALHRRALVQFLQPPGDAVVLPIDRRASGAQAGQAASLVLRLLHSLAQQAPVLLALDDAQWADSTTLGAVGFLADLLVAEPVLLVVANRSDELTPAAPALRQLLRGRAVTAVELSRLTAAGVADLVADRLGAPSPDLAVRLHALTAGVPFFVEQYLAVHQADGVLPGSIEVEARNPLPVPIEHLLARRLAGLSTADRDLLQVAATAGDPFWAEWLAAVCGYPESTVLARLAGLEEQGGILHSARESLALDGRFHFHHPLIRWGLYQATPAARRRLLHSQLAAALAARCEDQPEWVFVAAHHYRAIADRHGAGQVLLRAGQRALALGEASESVRYAREALEAVMQRPDGDRGAGLVGEIEETWGRACLALNDTDGARRHWHVSLQCQPDPLRRSGVHLLLATANARSESERQQHLEAGLHETAAYPDSRERCRLLTAWVRAHLTDLEGARRCACEAVRLLRRQPDAELWTQLLLSLGDLRDHRRLRLDRCRRLLNRALRLATDSENWDLVLAAYGALHMTWRGVDLQRAMAMVRAGLDLAEAYLPPDSGHAADLCGILGSLHLACGEPEEAQRFFARGRGGLPAAAGAHDGFLPVEATWQVYAETLAAYYREARDPAAGFSQRLSRWQRFAHRVGRQAEFADSLAALARTYPAHCAPAVLLDDAPVAAWHELPVHIPLARLAPAGGRGAGRCIRRAEDQVDMVPEPEVGLGWLGLAPCLLTALPGDFALQVQIRAEGPAQRAGGVAVRSGAQWLRLGSGVDHVGQVSLCLIDGPRLRVAAVGYLDATSVWLRLVRAGTRYTASMSPDGTTWRVAGETDFGPAGAVQVGLFAECSYEYGFPQPFPVSFAGFRLQATAPPPPSLSGLAPPPAPRHSGLAVLPPAPTPWLGMVGECQAFQAFCDQLQRLAVLDRPQLILGETGTGKELAALALHQLHGPAGRPFRPVNVGSLGTELVDTELFGHVRGAFTGAHGHHDGLFVSADGGTLFLDEIGELPLAAQVKLLRAIELGEIRAVGATRVRMVNVRCLAATNRDLHQAVAHREFRQDLLYRLGQPLKVPPLRDRRDDLPFLVSHFLSVTPGGITCSLTHGAMRRLAEHPWPGNIRELRAVLEEAISLAAGGVISVDCLRLRLPSTETRPSGAGREQPPASGEELLGLLDQCGGSVTALGEHLGLSRRQLYRWFKNLGVDLAAYRAGQAGRPRGMGPARGSAGPVAR